jgi:integrase/recombinase XerC
VQGQQQSDDVQRYLTHLRTQRKLSPHTLLGYGRDLEELCGLAGENGGVALDAMTPHHVRRFLAQLHARGLNPRSLARKLSAWRNFYHWLADEKPLACNPVEGIKAPKQTRPLPKALSSDEAVQLVSSPAPASKSSPVTQQCNRAMFELLYSSGLRVSELVALDLHYVKEGDYTSQGWIDFEAGEVTVTGKGGKMRRTPVGSAALSALRDWLPMRDSLAQASLSPDRHALFLTERHKRVSRNVVYSRLVAHGQALGLPGRVHPHVLRHSFASHVLQSSGDLRAVQEMLGHASIAATQIYTSLDFQRLAQVYDAAHPRAKKQTK